MLGLSFARLTLAMAGLLRTLAITTDDTSDITSTIATNSSMLLSVCAMHAYRGLDRLHHTEHFT